MSLRTLALPAVLASLTSIACLAGCAQNAGPSRTASGDEAASARAMQEAAASKSGREERGVSQRDLAEELLGDKPQGTKASERAQAKMDEARDRYRNDATARLERLNTRLVEAQRKLDAEGGRASAETRKRVSAAAADRTLLSEQISQLPIVRDGQWDATTKSIDARLNELEGRVDGLGDK